MRRFSINLCALAVSAALLATLAISRNANSTDLTTPSFLVATRDLQDPLFLHAVILMVPSTQPPLLAGLIINRPAKQRGRELFPQTRDLKSPQDTIYTGGPVPPHERPAHLRAAPAP